MNHWGVLKGVFVVFFFLIVMALISSPIANSQYCPFLDYYFYHLLSSGEYPASLLWIHAFQICSYYFDPYGFFNPIDQNLLGHLHYSPFLTYTESALYPSGTTFPYFGSQYMTTFPYTTLPKAMVPYTRFDYPAYVYGSPDFYLSWVLLQ
ncbi:MAG: hypothetical protein ACMUIU_14645 [bacterium]